MALLLQRRRHSHRRPPPSGDNYRVAAELAPYPAGYLPNSQLFDTGNARIPLTRSSNANSRRYQSRTLIEAAGEGIGTFYQGGATEYLRGPYRAQIAAWKGYGNAVSTGDFYIGGYVEVPAGFSVGTEIEWFSVRASGATAATTVFGFGLDGAGTSYFEFSDGTTLFRLKGATANMASSGRYYMGIERDGENFYYYFANCSSSGEILTRHAYATLTARARFQSPINFLSSEEISLGAPKAFSGFSTGNMLDFWEIRPHRLYGGATSFPVPDRPFGLSGPRASDTTAVPRPTVQLRFEASPGFLVDDGSAASTWTNSNGVNATSSPKSEAKYLTFASFTASTYFLSTTATTSNCMNGSGDCAMGGWYQQFALAGTSGYISGIREGAASASETGCFFYRGGGSDTIQFFYCDGTTISSIDTFVTATSTGVWRHLWAEQYTTGGTKKIYVYVDGVLKNAGGTAFSGAIPMPTGAKLRVGSLAYTVSGGAQNMCAAADLFQVYQTSLYKGAASFTPPVLGR